MRLRGCMIYLNVCFKMFKRFRKVVLAWKNGGKMKKNGVKWGKKLAPESANIHYCYILHVQNYLQKVFKLFKKTLHTSFISEGIHFFLKVVLKGDNQNAFKGFTLYHKS